MSDKEQVTISTPPMRLRLNTIPNTRRSFARVIRKYSRDELEHKTYKALVYGLSHYIRILSLELDAKVEEEIEAIQQKLKELENEKSKP